MVEKSNKIVEKDNEKIEKDNEVVEKNKDDKKKFKSIHKFFLVLGAVVLIGIVGSLLVFEDARITGWVILGNDFAELKQVCKNQCEIQNITDYCCNDRYVYSSVDGEIDSEYYTCQSDVLKTSCELDCEGVCENYCRTIKSMLPCAKSGCSWIVRGARGSNYCTTRKGY